MSTALKGIAIKKEVIITKVDDASGDYVIPEEIDGCVVTGIGNRAFHGCKNLRSVTIPEGVSQIDGGAFYCCDCLESFYVAKENARYKVIDGLLIEDDDTLVAIPGIMENVKIPKCVTKIGDDVCAGTKIKSVTFHDGITKIGECAFVCCMALNSVKIPASVKRICNSAFAFGHERTSVTIANGVEIIGEHAFFLNENIKELIIPRSVKEISDYAFGSCFRLERVTFEDVVENVSPTAFEGCDSLTNITFPKHVDNFLNTIRNIKNKVHMNKTLTDLRDASSSEVAIAFIAWLATATMRGDRMADANRRKYAMHLTAEYVSRLHTDLYNGTYNLFDLRGLQEVRRVLEVLRSTDAFKFTQRANGGNGAFQASFAKLESFWEFMEHGGVIDAEELNSARQIWNAVSVQE